MLDGPINGEAFLIYVEKVLAPTLQPGDVVVIDNLGSHKGKAVVWLHSQGSMLGASARSVGLLFDKDGRLVRVVNTTDTHMN